MITGTTRLFAILADPVGHVQAPQMINTWFEAHQIDGIFVPLHVHLDDLQTVVQGLRALHNLDGLVITMPHKTAMAALCDEVGAAARAIGSVNTVRRTPEGRLIGDMFDGHGFVAGLEGQGITPQGQRILLLGAGGAATAIALALFEAGAATLTIANRTQAKAEALQACVQAAHPGAQIEVGAPDPRGHDMVINATSLGMKPGDALPIDTTLLDPTMTAVEIITKPEFTPWLDQARKLGCRTHIGRHMLQAQIDQMARFMLGHDAGA
ncbi:shikimate dehydrogenase [Castellaniella sp.]|uniref:shikimate dehydrogenase family protein n=1 Tax=Castellaniella sp. TaxID=1955812 RepID=UPI003568F282